MAESLTLNRNLPYESFQISSKGNLHHAKYATLNSKQNGIDSILVPSHPPVNITATNTSSTSLLVQWNPVPSQHRNGIIRGYQVTYWKSGDDPAINQSLITSCSQKVEIRGLKTFTRYGVVVAAFTRKGLGNFSQPIEEITDEDSKG